MVLENQNKTKNLPNTEMPKQRRHRELGSANAKGVGTDFIAELIQNAD